MRLPLSERGAAAHTPCRRAARHLMQAEPHRTSSLIIDLLRRLHDVGAWSHCARGYAKERESRAVATEIHVVSLCLPYCIHHLPLSRYIQLASTGVKLFAMSTIDEMSDEEAVSLIHNHLERRDQNETTGVINTRQWQPLQVQGYKQDIRDAS